METVNQQQDLFSEKSLKQIVLVQGIILVFLFLGITKIAVNPLLLGAAVSVFGMFIAYKVYLSLPKKLNFDISRKIADAILQEYGDIYDRSLENTELEPLESDEYLFGFIKERIVFRYSLKLNMLSGWRFGNVFTIKDDIEKSKLTEKYFAQQRIKNAAVEEAQKLGLMEEET